MSNLYTYNLFQIFISVKITYGTFHKIKVEIYPAMSSKHHLSGTTYQVWANGGDDKPTPKSCTVSAFELYLD